MPRNKINKLLVNAGCGRATMVQSKEVCLELVRKVSIDIKSNLTHT